MKPTTNITPLGTILLERLPDFLSGLNEALDTELALIETEKFLLRTYLDEVKIGLGLIAPHIQPQQRVLEIGSGIGALGCFLSMHGVDVTGIEPSADGFGTMDKLSRWVKEHVVEPSTFESKNKGCEDLNRGDDGQFDLIYSVHVLEHVSDLPQAFKGMTRVLNETGRMVHICPNYHFPYEPHFFIPVVFWSPKLTKLVYRRRINSAPELWASLNFITSRQIKALGNNHGFTVEFRGGVMADYFRRLMGDQVFTQRHNGFAAKIATLIARSPLIKVLAKTPPELTSPVSFTLRKRL